MGRRVTSGVAGGSGLGAINILGNRLTSVTPDADIELAPNGTGDVVVFSDIDLLTQNDLKFFDTDSSNYVAFQAPSTVASDITWTLPAADGALNQVLTTSGTGTLTWTSSALPITDETSDATTHYPLLTTATSGTGAAFRVSSTKFSFQPSTGNLIVSGSITSNGATVPSGFTSAYSSTGLTLDGNGFITAFTANGIAYTSITYTELAGVGSGFGASYRVPVSWTETDSITTVAKSIAVTYDANGLVSTITVT
jgi:hypothetical protein